MTSRAPRVPEARPWRMDACPRVEPTLPLFQQGDGRGQRAGAQGNGKILGFGGGEAAGDGAVPVAYALADDGGGVHGAVQDDGHVRPSLSAPSLSKMPVSRPLEVSCTQEALRSSKPGARPRRDRMRTPCGGRGLSVSQSSHAVQNSSLAVWPMSSTARLGSDMPGRCTRMLQPACFLMWAQPRRRRRCGCV